MTHLIWSILNGMIIIYFLYLLIGFIIRGKQIFKPKIKIASIFLMVIGVVQIISASNSKKQSNRITLNKDFVKTDKSQIKDIILEDNVTFDLNLHIKYSIDRGEYVPIESNSFLTGLVSGYVWKIKSFQASNFKSNETGEYIVNGVLKWNFFGFTIYDEPKTFKGKIK